MGDLRGDSLIRRLFLNILVLPAPLRLIEVTEDKFRGLTNTEGNIVLKFLIEWGIRTEEAECNLRGDIASLNVFVILIWGVKVLIPSKLKRSSYRSLNKTANEITEDNAFE
ncbi:MAG: hypothetical protein JAY75_19740 [Candidatus Thiodiazotropha taylori]|nr:hypothetical protein [Candidatus Thiodiazotropha taylori]MCW4310453.1 hypothetical protein [Candidatus Thiodiazotropha endolucinida]